MIDQYFSVESFYAKILFIGLGPDLIHKIQREIWLYVGADPINLIFSLIYSTSTLEFDQSEKPQLVTWPILASLCGQIPA